MPKLRRKFIIVFAVLFCALLALSTVSVIPKTKTASAARGSNWTEIEEIYSGNDGFDAENMQKLYAALTGNENATYKDVANLLESGDKTSQDVRDNQKKFENNNGNNVSVTFGGIKWDVVYLTTVRSDDKEKTDSSIKGDIVIDLWLSSDQIDGNLVQFSTHASSARGDVNYPCGMYGRSYIRAYINGTKDGSGNDIKYSTTTSGDGGLTFATSEGKYCYNSDWVNFIDNYSDYLVQPKDIQYQEELSSIGTWNPPPTYQLANDAYSTTITGTGIWLDENKISEMQKKDGYADWKNDYLWIPAFAETGSEDGYALWKTDVALRSTSKAVWIRSTTTNQANFICYLQPSGNGDYYANTTSTCAVRPAIHFNLTKAKTLYTKDVETTYTGSEITLDSIYNANKSEIPWYIPEVYSADVNCDYSDTILNVGTYTVTMKFNNNSAVSDLGFKWDKKSLSSTVKITVKKKQIEVTSFTINSTTNQPEAHLNPLQICNNDTLDDIEAKLYYTYTSEGGTNYNEQPTTPGKYKVTVKIKDCNYYIEEKTIDFTVDKKKPNFDAATDLEWIYTNKNIDGGKEKDITSGGSVTYNGEDYNISLKDGYYTKLAEKGLKVDSFGGDLRKQDASNSAYTATVKIVTLDKEMYDFEDTVVELKWYIEKATFYLSSLNDVIEWSYTARGEDHAYTSAGAEYEGGAGAGEDGYIKIYISGGLPSWLTPNYDEISCKQREVGPHTAKITSFKSTNDNYNLSEEGANWLEYEWQIVARTLSVDKWTTVQYTAVQEDGYGYVTVAPTLITLPYNPALTYKYYKTSGGEEIDFGDLKYAEGQTETYYVEAVIAESDSGNWILSGRGNPHGFEIGKDKQAVEITITAAGGIYDGTAKEAVVEIIGTVPGISINSFDIIYYKSGSSDGSKTAPKDAGNYYVEVTLKEAFTETYYIKSTNVQDFVITKRLLTIPEPNITLTYDGTVRDVAELCGLDEGWGNYIDVEIAGMGGNTDTVVKNMGRYSVTLSIKSGINDNVRNVEWDTDSSAAKIVPQSVYITVERLVLNAQGWYENGYYSRIQFDEKDFDEEDYAEKFVVYKVYDEDGKEVDYAAVRDSVGMMFVVEVSVDEIHGENVIIEFAPGVTARYEFFTTGGQEPVQVELPTIGDLIFNGKSQTFTVDYGKFAEYIEIEQSLSDLLTQLNVGEYTVYFKIKSGKNALWTTGGRGATPVTFEMKPLVLDDPKVDENQKFTYTGSEQSAILNIEAAMEFMIIEGDYKATNAGKYTFTLSIDPRFAGNVLWASAEGEKSVEWTIEKAKISVKWTDGDVPELDLPAEFKDLDVEYEFTDENGKKVSKDELEPGKSYTVTATLSDGSSANYEFVDDDGKTLATPAKTDGMSFQYKSAGSAFPWWILALIAGVLLLLAVLIIIIVKRRQVADGEDEYDDFYDDEYDFDEEEEIEEDDDFGGDDF